MGYCMGVFGKHFKRDPPGEGRADGFVEEEIPKEKDFPVSGSGGRSREWVSIASALPGDPGWKGKMEVDGVRLEKLHAREVEGRWKMWREKDPARNESG